MSEDIYTQFGIDKSKLKRDYITNPLKKVIFNPLTKRYSFEKPLKEDLEYLYLELNLNYQQLQSIFNVNQSLISFALKQNNIIKKHQYKPYDDSKIFNFLKRNYLINPIKMISRTNQGGLIYEKPLKEDLEYLYINQNLTKEDLSHIFNVSYSTIYQWFKFYNIKKPLKMVLNNSLGHQKMTKPEQTIYLRLLTKFQSIIYQYFSSSYPFNCDFYIPEIDTYIEYQGYWTHGKEPYDKNNPLHQEKVKLWESKNTVQYIKAIKDWTERDVLKRKTAKNNGLNWIEFFNIKEFENWFKNIRPKKQMVKGRNSLNHSKLQHQ